jgi:hypothetical protein
VLATPERQWLTEGEPLSVQLSCSSDVELEGRQLELVGLPAGAAYDDVTGVVTWTPALDQAAVYEIQIDMLETGARSQLFVGVVDARDDPNNVPVTDPTRYTEEYGVPVFFVDTAPTEEVYMEAAVTYRGEPYLVEAKLRGASSLTYPKQNYTLKFDGDERFNAPDLGAGFVARKKMVLTSTFDDNSYVRQRLAFDLWNLMDAEHLQIHASSAVVYMGGHYHGLYTVTDHVDRHLMQGLGMLETGNLYKAGTNEADFRVKEPLHAGMTKKEGLPEDDYSDLGQLITFIDTASDEDFRAGIEQMLDLRDYRDWWVFVTLIGASDSAGKNSYHYIERPGAPARFAPWDFNASFGQSWKTVRVPADGMISYTHKNRIFERLLADPEQAALMKSRRRDMLQGVFHADAVDALLDGYLDEIAPSAQRDFAKWEPEYRNFERWSVREDFTSFEQEVAYVRTWYRARWTAFQNGAEEAPAGEASPELTEPITGDSSDSTPNH